MDEGWDQDMEWDDDENTNDYQDYVPSSLIKMPSETPKLTKLSSYQVIDEEDIEPK